MARLPELAAAGGVQEGAIWTGEISGEGWGVAEGPMDSKGGGAVRVLRILCAGLPTHHLGRKRSTRGEERSRVVKGQYADLVTRDSRQGQEQ